MKDKERSSRQLLTELLAVVTRQAKLSRGSLKQAIDMSESKESWKQYQTYRPGYPDSVWAKFTNYHRGRLQRVLDVGTGSGNGVEGLMTHCHSGLTHVVLTDPKESNMQDARTRFENRFLDTNFTYRAVRGEDPWDLPDGLDLDLVMACESLHWADYSPTLAQAARYLRKGGTLAAVTYAPFPVITNNEAAADALEKLIQTHVAKLMGQGWMNDAWARMTRQLADGMDALPLDTNVWSDIQRIDINCHRSGGWRGEHKTYEAPESYALGPGNKKVRHIEIKNCADWQRVESVEWLRQMLDWLKFGFSDESWQTPEWQALVKAVGDDTLSLEWKVQMVLARKRGAESWVYVKSMWGSITKLWGSIRCRV